MKKLIFVFLALIALSVFWFSNNVTDKSKVIAPRTVMLYIGDFNSLRSEIMQLNLSDLGYENLLLVLKKISSTEGMYISQVSNITSVKDSVLGVQRLLLRINNNENPLMLVEILICLDSVSVEYATLVL